MKKVKRCEEQGRIYRVEVESSGNIKSVCTHVTFMWGTRVIRVYTQRSRYTRVYLPVSVLI